MRIRVNKKKLTSVSYKRTEEKEEGSRGGKTIYRIVYEKESPLTVMIQDR